MLQTVFPDYTYDQVMNLLDNPAEYTPSQQEAIIDYVTLNDRVHVFFDIAMLFSTRNNIDFSRIDYENNHFFIKGKNKEFIPDDGNCFFHAFDYLSNEAAV